ncbi:MAG: hypothetical protein ACJ74J_20725 [Blastocatellia bacterium]
MRFFQDLGALVEQRWRDEDYNEERFPAIAEQALIETAPHTRIDPWEVIRWVNTAAELPEQQDIAGRFGNPPLTLFNGPRFYVDIYYWLDGTTTIHQHAFSGAFQVLLGSSLHSQYDFEEERRINPHFSVGRVSLRQVELLKQGGVRPIWPGKLYIHSLFHLDRPSASIVIRTRRTPQALPQYNYYKPYFAMDPFYESAAMNKRLQSAALLLGMEHPRADEMIGELLACADFQTTFTVIELLYNRLPHNPIEERFGLSLGRQRLEALFDTARRRHGALVDLIAPVFAEAERQAYLSHRRGQITSIEHRFFLALLLNVPDRSRVLDLVHERFPDRDPIAAAVSWTEELASTRAIASAEANVLGIEGVDDDYLFVFECLLKGFSLEQTRRAFADDLSAADAENQRDKPEFLYSAISNSMAFRSLFLNPAQTPTRVILPTSD